MASTANANESENDVDIAGGVLPGPMFGSTSCGGCTAKNEFQANVDGERAFDARVLASDTEFSGQPRSTEMAENNVKRERRQSTCGRGRLHPVSRCFCHRRLGHGALPTGGSSSQSYIFSRSEWSAIPQVCVAFFPSSGMHVREVTAIGNLCDMTMYRRCA